MRIDIDLFRRACELQGDPRPVFLTSPPPAYIRWIESRNYPMELKEFLTFLILADEFGLGTNTLHTPARVIGENQEFPHISQNGFCVIGSATNGDMVAIEYLESGGDTGYLSHDKLWTWDQPDTPNSHECFLPLAESVGQYAMRAIDCHTFPLDYYGTKPDFED